MPTRQVVIVAPTASEAIGEADGLDVPRQDRIIADNGSPYVLQTLAIDEGDVVRVRETGWSDELRSLLDEALSRESAS